MASLQSAASLLEKAEPHPKWLALDASTRRVEPTVILIVSVSVLLPPTPLCPRSSVVICRDAGLYSQVRREHEAFKALLMTEMLAVIPWS